jgi:hypothetical protein
VAKAGTNVNFEGLYAVDAIDRTNLDGRLVSADKINTANIWTSTTTVASVSSNKSALQAP